MRKPSFPIQLRGALENNLKGIDLDIFPGELVVITGLSGTGKSSLLFDVLHAEGQRRYVETFSPYVRQFMESLPRPKVDSMANARPSISVEQKNSVRNSRSTVGTMTELCDFFKVWFPQVAKLHDPDDNERVLEDESASTQSQACISEFTGQNIVLGFWVERADLSRKDFFRFLISAGHARILHGRKYYRIEDLFDCDWKEPSAFVVVDRMKISPQIKNRLTEAISLALNHGKGMAEVRSMNGKKLRNLHLGLRSRTSGKKYEPLGPNAFSFNSPIGACPKCKGFGRVIEINPNLVIPDPSLSISGGAIKPFEGKVYKHCLQDLLHIARAKKIDTRKPWRDLPKETTDFVWNGDPKHQEGDNRWYGISSFFNWIEKKTYKMHVRVFLSKYRGYFVCPDCKGSRFRKKPQLWKWNGHSLPSLYSLPISELLPLLESLPARNDPRADLPLDAILLRLGYLRDVGLDYLSLDRTSRSLSGGETQRINLTACLGAGLTDTLFALDEPTIGLHHQDVSRLIGILRNLADTGNCVCVVEHDDQVIRSADKIIEIGPKPGSEGGRITFQGSVSELLRSKVSETGKWLSGKMNEHRKILKNKGVKPNRFLKIRNACVHNLIKFNANIPLGRFTCVAGLSGSGKSSLLHDLIFQELSQGCPNGWVTSDAAATDLVMVDQGSVGRSSRSNPVLYSDAWNPIKEAFARTSDAKRAGFSASDFSFNSGQGRCDSCAGLGYETVEMQFLPDLAIPCSLCEGKRFKDHLLEIRLDGLNVAEVLDLSISEAENRFSHLPKTYKRLGILKDLGLGYLKLGQPLSTLSGGESQRLKLAKYMIPACKSSRPAILLLDEPTTGLHLSDVQMLISCLRKVVDEGHSLLVIEHHPLVLSQAEWILELGPGAGKNGGKLIAEGHPEDFLSLDTPTARLLKSTTGTSAKRICGISPKQAKKYTYRKKPDLEITGARENNLKNLDLKIPSNQFVVITGPSGSGKSSLAFDVVFAEGQRRFLDSMSSYSRQFVEQIGRPKVDQVKGISPTVAIEQRVTRGSKKSTVGTITEISQYLRLLYARVGIQHSPKTGKALVSSTPQEIARIIAGQIKGVAGARLLAPLVTSKKGHHKPMVNWAREQGFQKVRCDGRFFSTESFEGLDRYSLHDIEVLVNDWQYSPKRPQVDASVNHALAIGRGRCLLQLPSGSCHWFSTRVMDPSTGQSFPDLEPSLLSWNSPRGWCSSCHGYGRIYEWMKDELPACGDWWKLRDGDICPTCNGERLGPVGRHVLLESKSSSLSLPGLLALTPAEIIEFLAKLVVKKSERAILDAILPEVAERLRFMTEIGLEYLALNRETSTLSGGESQRIRLAGQLGSNLSGVLYVLDEPSIGLHPSDNQKLIDSLRRLQSKGNSLLVVEHDQETIRQADCLIEIGPSAGEFGGRVLEVGSPLQITENNESPTGKYLKKGLLHPLRGNWRPIPKKVRNETKDRLLRLANVKFRNLRNLNLVIPVGRLIVCCGVSGAGKSSLVRGVLLDGVRQSIRQKTSFLKMDDYELSNGHIFAKAIEVSQSPIGKTSRSTPATYLGVWTRIRELISSLPEAKARGMHPSAFSFNVKGGRCERCKGAGRIKLEMNFLPDSYIQCEDCLGNRYRSEILDMEWKGKNVAQILDMSFEDALEFFAFDEFLKQTFQLMTETGLGYLKLGQTSPTLSGGEAQRLKLATELATGIDLQGTRLGKRKSNLYVLEEPTIGLHPKDCEKLIFLLHRLVDDGHTVVVIEHDVDLIAEADFVIELGPRGGKQGGRLLHQGSVSALAKKKNSPTAQFIRKAIDGSSKG